jgi:hypothetical protein
MANIIYGIKPSFAGGEYCPALYSRVDLQRYATGAKKLLNFIVHPHGGISNRPGTHFIAQGKYANKKIRLVPFEFSTTQTYTIEFGDYYCRFITNSGQLLVNIATLPAWAGTTPYVLGDWVSNSGVSYYCLIGHTSGTFSTDLAAGRWVAQTIYEIPSPYSEADLVKLGYTQSADVLFLVHPSTRPMELIRYGATDWALEVYDFKGGPFQISNVDTGDKIAVTATSGNCTLNATGFTFDTGQVDGLYKLTHYVEGAAVTASLVAPGATASIKCGGTWRFITHGTWTGTIRIEKSTDAGSNWTMLREFSSVNDFNVDTYGTEDMSGNLDPFLVRVNATALASGSCNVNLTSDPFYQEGVVQITSVAGGGASAQATVKRQVGATTTTIDFAEGSWSDYRGWPLVVEFHPEDRLVFGNTTNEPNTYWMTKTGDYYDFSRSSPLVDSDGISSPIPSRQVNGINGIVALTELILFTASLEATARSSSGPLSPKTLMNRIHGYEGSYGVRPVVVGNRTIYVQSVGSVVRDLGYELMSDSFVGSDVTVLSNHLFAGYAITELAYQQNPDRLVWAIRDDGELLSLTYLREQEVVAWTHHNTNFGTDKFESVACIRGTGYDQVWFSVNRGGTRFIELMDRRGISTVPADQFFVDCGITYSGPATDVIGGLSHLEGKTVSILANGNVHLQKVVTGGLVYLDGAYTKVHIGLQYYSDLQTLSVEVSLPDGTAQGRKMKISKVVFRLTNSRGGWIGSDATHLLEMTVPYRAYYNNALDLYSGDQKETLGGGYEDGGSIFFRQKDPLPVTINAIIPSVTIGGMTSV